MLKKLFLVVAIFSVTICFMNVKAMEEPKVSALAAVLLDAKTGQVLYSKNGDKQLAMASTTKIMTALLALEQPDLDTPFAINSAALKVEGSSMGLAAGDMASLRTLSAGMLLSSGNDAANAVAYKLGGSLAGFAKLMNARALKIGMKNTSFVTPSGLDAKDHYSTAYDMALLGAHALKNENFSNLCSQKSVTVEVGNPLQRRRLSNHNRLLKEYEGCIGIKTGFTKKSGRCLVSASKRDGVTLVCVTLHAPSDWKDHKTLFDYGFSQYEPVTLDTRVDNIKLTVVNSPQTSVKVEMEDPRQEIMAVKGKSGAVIRRVYIKPFEYAPVTQGQIVGSIVYSLEGQVVYETELLAAEDAALLHGEAPKKKGIFEKIADFFKNLF